MDFLSVQSQIGIEMHLEMAALWTFVHPLDDGRIQMHRDWAILLGQRADRSCPIVAVSPG